MKITELKLGDILSYEGKPSKVHAIDRDCTFVVYGDDEGYSAFEEDEALSPIPLTKEILEKNEWQWDEDDLVFYSEFCPHVYLEPSGKGFNVVDASGEQLGRINAAAHELQHLLWALGMDDDLKI